VGCVVRGYVSGAEDVQVQVGAAVCAEIGTAVKPRHRRSKLAARARVKKKKKKETAVGTCKQMGKQVERNII